MSILSRLDRASTTFGVSRISRNSSTSLSRRFMVRLALAPWRPWAATNRSKVLRSDRSRVSASSTVGPVSTTFSSSVVEAALLVAVALVGGGGPGGGHGRGIPIAETDDHVVQPAPAVHDRAQQLQHELDDARIAGEGGDDLLQPFLDAAGDPDLSLPGEEVHGAHLAHVHPHRIGGAPELRVQGGEGRGRLFGGVLVGVDLGLHHQQVVGIRGHFVHRDAHIVDHADDVFDLLRIDNAFREMIVHLGIREVSLLLALGDEELEARLLVVEIHDVLHCARPTPGKRSIL